jgi:hypothetical protein
MALCNDCGGQLMEGQIKSRKFGVYLCRTCFEIRTGWDKVLEAAGSSDVSNAELEALAEKARLASRSN